eukprot:m.69498 g.69498  ORF g.69498 m.69498 type:complete len:204 (+) comp14254_c1_seq2:251-862(+)
MALYVARVKAHLEAAAPGYMELDSICFPPVDFRFALNKARADLTDALAEAERTDATVLVTRGARFTFMLLLVELHARASQEFWAHVDIGKAFAYLYYRAMDITVDVVSKTDLSNEAKVAALEAITTDAACEEVRREYDCMVAAIMAQRKAHAADPVWHPDTTDIWRVIQEHAVTRARRPGLTLALVAGAVAVAALAWWRFRRH